MELGYETILFCSWGKEGSSLKVLGSPEKEATPGKLNQRWRGALSLMTSLGSQTWTGPPTPGPSIHEAHHRWFCPRHLNSWWDSRYPDFGSVQTRGWTLVDVGGKQAFPWASIKTRIETIGTILFAMLLYLKFTTFPMYVHFSVPRSNSKH